MVPRMERDELRNQILKAFSAFHFAPCELRTLISKEVRRRAGFARSAYPALAHSTAFIFEIERINDDTKARSISDRLALFRAVL